jgi:methionyl-tRNA synthetase
MQQKNFYVTTPIFYPTGLPHIGTAYTVFIADTLARYYREQGVETFFLTGTDEHGANIAAAAASAGKDPKTYTDEFSEQYKQIWSDLKISNDFFVRTTDPRHEKFIQELIQKSYDNGDIYPGEYEGWYCSSCEAYYKEEDLVDGKCPNHPTKDPVFTKEKNYYFAWSKYRDWLLEYYEENPNFVRPAKWANYVKEFVKQGLQDIPVTRANVKWGVPVPFDPEQTIYVWYDALPNYLSVLNFPEYAAQNYEDKYWPEATHVIGKDIIKFHAILWPAMLKSTGYAPPKSVLTHGFFTIDGQKIGKSNNNAINPVDIANEYGLDAVRYALLSEFQVGNDGDFSFERLKEKYNSDLANNWGNLLSRVTHLADKSSVAWQLQENGRLAAAPDEDVERRLGEVIEAYHWHMQNFELFEALKLVNELAAFGNRYIDEKKPWASEHTPAEREACLHTLARLLDVVASLYKPVLPEAATRAAQSLIERKKVILFTKKE